MIANYCGPRSIKIIKIIKTITSMINNYEQCGVGIVFRLLHELNFVQIVL